MTAITAMSTLGSRVIKNPASALINSLGVIGTDCYPGQFVVKSSGVWTLAVSTTAAHTLKKVGCIDYDERTYINTSGAIVSPTIDSAIDISERGANIDVCTSGIVLGFCTDQSAAVEAGTYFMVSSTAGSLTQLAINATSGSLSQVPVAMLLRDIANGDTKGIFGIGKFMNERYCY